LEVKIIRGYKLKLWATRLNLAPEFIDQVDLTGLNYVHAEYHIDDKISVILFTKLRGNGNIIPVVLRITEEELENISERVKL
jgi:hypothetical protein